MVKSLRAAAQRATFIGFQGSWTLARTRRKSDVLRGLPARLYGPLPT